MRNSSYDVYVNSAKIMVEKRDLFDRIRVKVRALHSTCRVTRRKEVNPIDFSELVFTHFLINDFNRTDQ